MTFCIDIFEPDYKATPIPPLSVPVEKYKCNHTPQPEQYATWHEWARKASKTHAQVRCPGCGKWTVWLPKKLARKINRRMDIEAKAAAYAINREYAKRNCYEPLPAANPKLRVPAWRQAVGLFSYHGERFIFYI